MMSAYQSYMQRGPDRIAAAQSTNLATIRRR
jgi:hypothetical protein